MFVAICSVNSRPAGIRTRAASEALNPVRRLMTTSKLALRKGKLVALLAMIGTPRGANRSRATRTFGAYPSVAHTRPCASPSTIARRSPPPVPRSMARLEVRRASRAKLSKDHGNGALRIRVAMREKSQPVNGALSSSRSCSMKIARCSAFILAD
jgi:hypothetical protein